MPTPSFNPSWGAFKDVVDSITPISEYLMVTPGWTHCSHEVGGGGCDYVNSHTVSSVGTDLLSQAYAAGTL